MQKSKLLALLLAVAMVVSMLVVPAYAADATHCDKCGEVTWTAWTGTVEDGGHYQLSGPTSLEAIVEIAEGTVCIDLAGQTLTAPENLAAFKVTGGTLNIMDSTATANAAGTGKIAGNGTVTVSGGVLIVAGGVVNVYNGEIIGGKATSNNGVNIVMSGGATVNLYNYAKVTGGAAKIGGNIYINAATLNVFGNVQITGGSASSNGGNIGLPAANGVANIYGGTISGGSATTRGDDIQISNVAAELHVYGGNIGSLWDGTASSRTNNVINIYNGTVTAESGLTTAAGKLFAACSCGSGGITTASKDNTYTVWNWGHDGDANNGECTDANCPMATAIATATAAGNPIVISGQHEGEGTCTDCGTAFTGPELPTTAEGECEACDKNHTWNLWYADTDLAEIEEGGYWMLAESFQLDDQIDLAVNMCLDLNDQTLKHS